MEYTAMPYLIIAIAYAAWTFFSAVVLIKRHLKGEADRVDTAELAFHAVVCACYVALALSHSGTSA